DAAGAVATLAPCLDGSAPPLVAYQMLETLLLDAVAHQRLGDLDAAATSLEHALQAAEPEGHRQVFWNLGEEVHALLLRHRPRGRRGPPRPTPQAPVTGLARLERDPTGSHRGTPTRRHAVMQRRTPRKAGRDR